MGIKRKEGVSIWVSIKYGLHDSHIKRCAPPPSTQVPQMLAQSLVGKKSTSLLTSHAVFFTTATSERVACVSSMGATSVALQLSHGHKHICQRLLLRVRVVMERQI